MSTGNSPASSVAAYDATISTPTARQYGRR